MRGRGKWEYCRVTVKRGEANEGGRKREVNR
jgi:hypothetical protein